MCQDTGEVSKMQEKAGIIQTLEKCKYSNTGKSNAAAIVINKLIKN